MPNLPMPKSDADDIEIVNKEINELYEADKDKQEQKKEEDIKQEIVSKYDKKLSSTVVMRSEIDEIVNEIKVANEVKLDEFRKENQVLREEIDKLKRILLRQKAQGKAAIETEKTDPIDNLRNVYGGFADL